MTPVERFAADYFVREQLTAGRQRDVRRALAELERICGAPPERLDDSALRRFVREQLEAGLHPNTVRKNLKAVKPFYRWAALEGIVDPMMSLRIREVPPPRGSTGNGRPRPYKREEIERFYDQLDARWPRYAPDSVRLQRFANDTSPYRSVWKHAMHLQIQAVMSLALFGGLRATEIRLASLDDIHPDNEFVSVRGKSPAGERQGYREVPYTVEGRRMVGEWLEFRAVIAPRHKTPWLVLDASAGPNNRLAPSHPYNPIGVAGFEKLMPRVGKGWELHRFRHTCATEWLRAGVELEKVQRLLGHANMQQTLGYAELVRGDIAKSMLRGEDDFVTAVSRRHRRLVK